MDWTKQIRETRDLSNDRFKHFLAEAKASIHCDVKFCHCIIYGRLFQQLNYL